MQNFDKIDLARLLNSARVKLTGASDIGLKQELFDVLQEFFKDSISWLTQIQVTTKNNVTEYDISEGFTSPVGVIIKLIGVVDASNFNISAQMSEPSILSLRDAPTTGQVLTVTVAMNVSLPIDSKLLVPEFPQWVLPLWHIVILDGLLGKMMSQQNKSYSDDSKSVYHLRRFRDGIAQARVAAIRRNTYGTNTWVYPQNFRSRGQKGGISIGNAQRF